MYASRLVNYSTEARDEEKKKKRKKLIYKPCHVAWPRFGGDMIGANRRKRNYERERKSLETIEERVGRRG